MRGLALAAGIADEFTHGPSPACEAEAMLYRLLLVAVSALVAAGCGDGDSADECRPGVRDVDGARSRVFCGPATAHVEADGEKFSFENGVCTRTRTYLSVDIGVLWIDPEQLFEENPSPPDYFGLTVGRTPGAPKSQPAASRDGTYRNAVVTFNAGGGGYDLGGDAVVTVRNNRTEGEFSGRTVDGLDVEGTFSCAADDG